MQFLTFPVSATTKKQKNIHQNIKLLITTSDSTINLRGDWITLQTQDFHSEFLCGF